MELAIKGGTAIGPTVESELRTQLGLAEVKCGVLESELEALEAENERLRKQCAFYRRERQRDRARGAAVRLTRDEKRDAARAVALHVALGMVAAFAVTTAIVWCFGV